MRTILVPTDFSPQARNAAVHAAELAKSFNATLFLFHAYMLPTPVSEVPYVMVTVDELQKENETLIKKEAELLNEDHGLKIEWLVRIGIPSDEIKILSQERDIDLVVMGMKGVGGFDKIIGSTTVNAIRKLNIPVLVIPHEVAFKPLNNIVFSIDMNHDVPLRSYEPLVVLAKKYQAGIHIIHVHRPKEQSKDDNVRRQAVENVFKEISHDFSPVEDASVIHGINDYIEQHSPQLLVMVAHKHSFFERLFTKSQTRTMAYQTRIPLLILQDKA